MATITITDAHLASLRAFLRPATAGTDEEFDEFKASSEPAIEEEGQVLLYLAAFDEALQQRFAGSTDLSGDIIRLVADFRSVQEPRGGLHIDPRMAEAMIRGKFGLQPEPVIDPADVLAVQLLMLQLLVTDLRRLRGFDAAALEDFLARSRGRAAKLASTVAQLQERLYRTGSMRQRSGSGWSARTATPLIDHASVGCSAAAS